MWQDAELDTSIFQDVCLRVFYDKWLRGPYLEDLKQAPSLVACLPSTLSSPPWTDSERHLLVIASQLASSRLPQCKTNLDGYTFQFFHKNVGKHREVLIYLICLRHQKHASIATVS